MHRVTRIAVTCCAVLFTFGLAEADTLNMVDGANTAPGRPTRGMTMNKVESRFGSPERRVPAVGDPPISRWEYPGFIVYFEYDKVLHAVATR